MPESAENYVSQNSLAWRKRQAVWAWRGATLVVALWLLAIVLAPVFEANGVKSVSQPIYRFFSWICHQISSRSFHYHGEPLAVCARCFGFYGGFLAGFVAYPFFRELNNTDSFRRFWLFAAMIPMGIDFGLTFFGIWANTRFSRMTTGLILGFACAFFIIPALVEIGYFVGERARKR